MLLARKAYVEGGLALCLYAARLVDDRHTGETEQLRHQLPKTRLQNELLDGMDRTRYAVQPARF
jgi:hypothetical protein